MPDDNVIPILRPEEALYEPEITGTVPSTEDGIDLPTILRSDGLEAEVWCCDCGCVQFIYYETGDILCNDCGIFQEGHVPDPYGRTS